MLKTLEKQSSPQTLIQNVIWHISPNWTAPSSLLSNEVGAWCLCSVCLADTLVAVFSAEECGICEISRPAMNSPPPLGGSYQIFAPTVYTRQNSWESFCPHHSFISIGHIFVGISGLEVTWNNLNTHAHTELRVTDVMLDNVVFVHLDWILGILYLK